MEEEYFAGGPGSTWGGGGNLSNYLLVATGLEQLIENVHLSREVNRQHLSLLRTTEAKARRMEEDFDQEEELRLFEVVAPVGVAWRRTPQFKDRMSGQPPVERGVVVRATEVCTGGNGIMFAYVSQETISGWLPITTPAGIVVLRPAGEMSPANSLAGSLRASGGLSASPVRPSFGNAFD